MSGFRPPDPRGLLAASLWFLAALATSPIDSSADQQVHSPTATFHRSVGPAVAPRPVDTWATRAAAPLAAPAIFPLMSWPLEVAQNERNVVSSYFDLEPAVEEPLDYQCEFHNLDGSAGLFLRLYSFEEMDRGIRVIAATPGVVTSVGDGHPDRNTSPAAAENYVYVDHGDGSQARYLHLRRNSVAVKVGEIIPRGRVIGLIGSSGQSWAPQLELQVGDVVGPNWRARDPFLGPCQGEPSLWQSQPDYVGDNPLRFVTVQLFTETSGGGDVFDISYADYMEGLEEPGLFGLDEPWLPVLFQYQGRAADLMQIRVRRPNGTLFGAFNYLLPAPARDEWSYSIFPWAGVVGGSDQGTWRIECYANGVPATVRSFEVGPSTHFRPRFAPVGGRSIKINGTVQRDTLAMSALGDAVDYSLLNAPSFVTLETGGIVRFGPISDQPTRLLNFGVIAENGSAERDTMHYQVVDLLKPPGPVVDVSWPSGDGPELAAQPVGLTCSPNPFRGSVTIRMAAAADVPSRLSIYDVGGRFLRELAISRDGNAVWDARDAAGRVAAPGLYYARAEMRGREIVSALIRLP